MEQYIDKSAVVAEIEKLKDKVDDGSSYCNGWQQSLRMLEMELDTLRPQNYWKPSDEQMETLELIINSHSLDAYHLGMVQHLYNGLKTLKE